MQNGSVATEQGDAMFGEVKSGVNKWRSYMRDQGLFAGFAQQDMTWIDMVRYLYNGTANSVTYTSDGQSVTASNAGVYQNWTSSQILGSFMFNYQLNTGTVRNSGLRFQVLVVFLTDREDLFFFCDEQEFQYGGAAESIGVKNYDTDANMGVTPDWLFPRGLFVLQQFQ
jgi:hypothetical protein